MEIIIIIIITIIRLTAEQIWRASLLTPPKDALLDIFEPSPVPSWKLKSHKRLRRSFVAIHVRPPLQKGFVGAGKLCYQSPTGNPQQQVCTDRNRQSLQKSLKSAADQPILWISSVGLGYAWSITINSHPPACCARCKNTTTS
jgi:hypothetical protein